MTASSKAVGGLGSSGMVGICASLINVVIYDRPKLLIGLNQKVCSWITHCTFGLHGQECCRRIRET
jgi:hypothetical protein